ncbi:MAG TPA: HAMP domain-containing sensor histidine kinase [Polyangiaceae bacterium]|nr:HAMP domain-containing sensor histidine kinase [Polyangiaceae bacterium]
MRHAIRDRTTDARLLVYVLLGTLAGVVYVLFDILSEARLESGTLTGAMASAHSVIDRIVPILAGALLGVCAHYLKLRAQLASANEAAARAEALKIRLQRVERDQAVWVLVAAVLHELNNPLHAIGLLLDELGDTEGDEALRSDLVSRARAQADRALAQLTILRSMRTLAEPDFERIGLHQVVGALAKDVGALAAEHGLVVQVDASRPVLANADPKYVRTILENLLDNSMHALRGVAGGLIEIRLETGHGCALVSVCDNGPPLDETVRASLFEPLRTTKTQGLGLGLPIARALARAMGGELSFDDAKKKTFSLELPLGEAS